MRYVMLTASDFHRICEKVEKNHCPQSLLKTITSQYNTNLSVPSLDWGLKIEKVARELYARPSRSTHKKRLGV